MRLILVVEGDCREEIMQRVIEIAETWKGGVQGSGGAIGAKARRFDYEFSDVDYAHICDLIEPHKRFNLDTHGYEIRTYETHQVGG